MRKVLLILLLLMVIQTPVFSASKKMVPATGTDNPLPNIFIYSIPDDDTKDTDPVPEDIQYVEDKTPDENEEDAVILDMQQEDAPVLGATVLKGYAQYVEDTGTIHLKDDEDNFVLNIKKPQKISATKGLNLSSIPEKQAARYKDSEYHIEPNSIKTTDKIGNFSLGALYGNEVDGIAMLEKETGLFTKYEKEHFTLSSTYKKNLNTTYNQFYDTVSITPELKLNSYLSLKNTLKADITRNRRSSELTFSLNPFGKNDTDRMLLEVGAKQTVYMDNDFTKTELNFSTIFKL